MRRIAAFILALAIAPAAALAQQAFPGAEGFASAVTGGRGGTVYHVTNLNDTGPGSFRDAVSASNRIVVFDVGGVINLQSDISAKSNLTIAGQTAPGGGISLNGYELSFASSSNVIVRYLHLRPGDASPSSDDCLSLYNAKDIIVDHLSMQFAKWNNIDAVTDNGASPNVTIQSSIIADAIGQQFGAHLEAVNGHFTVANNLWVNNHNRNPLAKVNEQFVNNIEYNNEAGYTTHTSTPFKHDLVNNAFIFGPASGGNSDYYQLSTGDTFYATGNVQDTNLNGVLDPTSSNPTTGTIVSTPNFAGTTNLPTLSVADAYAYVLAHAGASLTRDDLDSLVLSQVQTLGSGTAGKTAGTAGPSGGLYGSAASTGLSNGGLGNTAAGSRPAGFDSDNDGIPDAWELAHGLNPSLASDALLLNPVGYRMIEQYVNELGDVNATRTYSAPSGSLTTASSWTASTLPGAMDNAVLTGTGSANGAATVSSGTLNVMKLNVGGNGPAAGESLTVTGGKLDVFDTLTIAANNNATVTVSGGTLEAGSIILGNTVYSPSATTYTGSLLLNGGTLRTGQIALGGGTPGNWTTGGSITFAGGTLQAISALRISAPATVASGFSAIFDTNGNSGSISGVISGRGSLTKIGNGTLTLAAANTYTGPTVVRAGILAIPALANGGAPSNLGASTSDPASLVLDGGTLQYAAPTGSAATSTDRSFTLTANGGTLDGGPSGGPQWRFLSDATIATPGAGNRTLTLTGATTLNDLYLGLGDPAGGGKTSLVMNGAGRWILTNSNRSYSGDTTVLAGTLMTNTDNPLPFGPGRGNVAIASGATFELNGHNLAINALSGSGTVNQRGNNARTLTLGYGDASGSFSGVLSDTYSSGSPVLNLVKVGLGTQTLTGANTYAGSTTVTAGKLVLAASAFAPLANGGAVVNAGNLVLDYTAGPLPATLLSDLQASHDASNFTDPSSRYRTTNPNDPAHGLGYLNDTARNHFTLAYTWYGDLNLDGVVNADDYALIDRAVAKNLAPLWSTGDVNYDGVIDSADYLLMDTSFGKQNGFLPESLLAEREAQFGSTYVAELTAAVPEPASLFPALAGAGLLFRRRRTLEKGSCTL